MTDHELKKAERLDDRHDLMHVDGWQYVSEQALAQEYTSAAADAFSLV